MSSIPRQRGRGGETPHREEIGLLHLQCRWRQIKAVDSQLYISRGGEGGHVEEPARDQLVQKASPRGPGKSEIQRANNRSGRVGGGRREAQPPAEDAQHRVLRKLYSRRSARRSRNRPPAEAGSSPH